MRYYKLLVEAKSHTDAPGPTYTCYTAAPSKEEAMQLHRSTHVFAVNACEITPEAYRLFT